MRKMKCARCSRIQELGTIGGCPDCGGDLIGYRELSRSEVSTGWQIVMVLVGLISIALSVVLGWMYGIVTLLLCVFLGFFGLVFGHLFPANPKRIVLLLGTPYVLIEGYFLLQLLAFILLPEYDGHFWNTEFFLAPAFLYLAPLILCFFGVQTGARKSLAFLGSMVASFAVAIFCLSYIGAQPVTRSDILSFDLVNNENIYLKAEVKCEYTVAKDQWSFRNFDRGECTDTIVTIVRKKDGLALPIDGYWTIDGVEEHVSMWPINRPHDGSALDGSKPLIFDDIYRWRTWSPFLKMTNAKAVSFRWGEIKEDFGPAQFDSMKELLEKYRRLAYQ